MGSSKRNLLTSMLLLVVMGVFAVLTIFIVVDAINKKYYNDIKVEYEVQEESPNVILTFARNEGSNFSTDNTKVVLNEDKTKFRIDGTVPTIENGIVTNLDDLTSSDGREFYFFSTNSSFIDPQEDPENPDFIFSETDSRYYVSAEDNPIWYDVPKSSENLTLYSVFLTPNVHNSDFANAPLLNTSPNVIISHDVTEIPYNAFSDALMESDLSMAAKIESVVIPNSTKSINSEIDGVTQIVGGAFAACTSLTNIIIPGSVEYVGGEAFFACTGLDTVEYENGYYLPTENNEYAILIDTNLKAENVTIHADCISIQGDTFSKYMSISLGLIPPPDMGDESNIEEILGNYINMNLQEIAIPKNVKSIGAGAFASCIGLENVVFEDNSDLTSIGMGSFIQCLNLKTINLEATKLEELSSVFESCRSLTSITIPDSVTSIGNSVFRSCSSLTSITIPDSVTSIGSSAFSHCGNLTSITIPDSVTSIGEAAFLGCSNIQKLYIDDLTSYLKTSYGDNKSGPLYSADQAVSLYVGGEPITNLEIPSEITAIPNYAFRSLNITSVTIPSSVTSIGDYAFSYCSNFTSITIPESVTSIGEWAFSSCNSLTSITIPEGVTSIGGSVFYGCSSLTSITISEGVTSIGSQAFSGCSSLNSITIPKSVTNIGLFAFKDCTGLTSITFEGMTGLTSIDKYSFDGCDNINELTIHSGEVKDLDFIDLSNLTTVTLGDGVTSIGVGAFSACSSLTSITIPESVTSIGSGAFRDCSSLTSITIPDSVTSIGGSAFYGCYKLVEVYDLTGPDGLNITVGSSDNGYVGYYAVEIKKEEGLTGIYYTGDNNEFVMYKDLEENHYLVDYKGQGGNISLPTFDDARTYFINKYAFYENLTITSIEIPSSVTSIESYAFSRCSSLTSIKIPDSVTSIGSYAFSNCSSLTSITIPESITSIESSAFSRCSSLTSITIPDSITSIGYAAFIGCSSLTSITIPDSITSIGESAFQACSSLTSIIIPDSVTSVGSYAFFACMNLTIYCEAESQPSGWPSNWNYSDEPVYWAGEWKMVDGVPVPIESGVEGVGLSEIGEDFGIGFDGLGFREELYFNDKRERKVV